MTVLVAGSSNLDFVVRADHIPSPGETVLGREFNTYPGGKGANQAVAVARAGGVRTRFLTAMGNDVHATPIEQSLRGAGVEVDLVRSSVHATGTAFICVDDAAQNAITVAPGANLALSAEHLPELQGISHLLMQLEIPLETVNAYAAAARQQGCSVILNAAPAPTAALPHDVLRNVDVLVVNEGELRTLTNDKDTIAQCLKLLPVRGAVVTLGQRGTCAWIHDRFYFQTAFAVQAVDTTGAGDTFCGVFAAALAAQATMETALRRASAAAALACTQAGAQSSIPTALAVDAFLSQYTAPADNALNALQAYCGYTAAHS